MGNEKSYPIGSWRRFQKGQTGAKPSRILTVDVIEEKGLEP